MLTNVCKRNRPSDSEYDESPSFHSVTVTMCSHGAPRPPGDDGGIPVACLSYAQACGSLHHCQYVPTHSHAEFKLDAHVTVGVATDVTVRGRVP